MLVKSSAWLFDRILNPKPADCYAFPYSIKPSLYLVKWYWKFTILEINGFSEMDQFINVTLPFQKYSCITLYVVLSSFLFKCISHVHVCGIQGNFTGTNLEIFLLFNFV